MKMLPLFFLVHVLVLATACSKRDVSSDADEEPTEEAIAEAFENGFSAMRRDDLEEKYAEWEAAQPLLKKISVSDFKIVTEDYRDEIEARFTNGTDRAILMIACQFIEKDPRREIPYTDDEVKFYFRGGLEPGESKVARTLDVNTASEPNLERTLTPTILFDGQSKRIADGSMTKAEAAELLELRKSE